MTISDWLNRAKARLTDSGCPDPDIDARWIAEDALGMTRQELLFESDRAIDHGQLAKLESMLDRRCAGEPVQYVLASADFMGLRFQVTHDVLIPRQDTELLAESALIDLRQRPGTPDFLDLCAGSGCVGLSVASLAPHVSVTLSDISREALEVARRNARELGVKADIRHGDLFDAVGRQRFDVIACNPPYIPTADLDGLQREVRFEPRLALDGGADGLDFYRRIAEGVWDHLKPGGALYLEVGIDEAAPVEALLRADPRCAETGRKKDLNGIDRVVWCGMQ